MDNIEEQLRKMLNEKEEMRQLLELLWRDIGPYGGAMETETMIKLQNFMKFDDSAD